MSHNSNTRSLPLSHSIPVILSVHLYVKHKTIVGNDVYIHVQFVILAIGITFSCLATIVMLLLVYRLSCVFPYCVYISTVSHRITTMISDATEYTLYY